MDRFQYLLVLAACVLVTLPLEFAFGARVWRRPRRLARAVLPAFATFVRAIWSQLDLRNPAQFSEAESLLLRYHRMHGLRKLHRRRLDAMTCASLLREAMWSMVQEIHASLAVDYRAYTAENLARYERAYAAFAT